MMASLVEEPPVSTALATRFIASMPQATHQSSVSSRLTLPCSLASSSSLRGGSLPAAS